MSARIIRAILVDPLLFTAPYDAALTQGLLTVGVEPLWMTRPSRWCDQDEIPRRLVEELFYRHIDAVRLPGLLAAVKAIVHAVGLVRLVRRVRQLRPDIVHFQWVVAPALDTLAIWFIRRSCPVVLTVHDTVPVRTHGKALSALQAFGLNVAIASADRVIVHTASGKQTLIRKGIAAERIVAIAHGPLRLRVAAGAAPVVRDARWTFVLFGELKAYKGLEVLIDAVAKIPAALAVQAHVIIAGRPCMDLRSIEARMVQSGLGATIELRPWRHSEEQMAELFARTDTFLFPYRHIDASGVYCLVKSLGKWLIASRVGIFSEDIPRAAGVLIAPGDSDQLAQAMASAIVDRPAGVAGGDDKSWQSIASLTQATYLSALLPGSRSRPRKAIGTAATR